MFYIFLSICCYFILKDVKTRKIKKFVVVLYSSILFIGLMYNFGEFVGEQFYLLGFSI